MSSKHYIRQLYRNYKNKNIKVITLKKRTIDKEYVETSSIIKDKIKDEIINPFKIV